MSSRVASKPSQTNSQSNAIMNKQPCTNYRKFPLTHRHFLFAGARSLVFLAATLTLFVAGKAHAAATVDYIVTAPQDPVKPGARAEFDITLRNLSGVQQNVFLHFTVPQNTTFNGALPGTDRTVGTFFIAAGQTQSAKLLFDIPGGNTAPPDGRSEPYLYSCFI